MRHKKHASIGYKVILLDTVTYGNINYHKHFKIMNTDFYSQKQCSFINTC